MLPALGKRVKARRLFFGLVSPLVVSAVTGGPYQGTPLLVEIARWPPWSRAALGGGHTPRVPAWKCIACWALSRPFALTETLATLPSSCTTASPVPCTLLYGTGPRSLAARSPADADDAAVVDDGESEDVESRIAVTTAAAHTRARAAIAGTRRLRGRPPPAGAAGADSAGAAAAGTGDGSEAAISVRCAASRWRLASCSPTARRIAVARSPAVG